MKNEGRRRNGNQRNGGCENHAVASRASCLCGTTSQLSCQLVCARARRWFEREHGFEKQSQPRRHPRFFQLSDWKNTGLLSTVDFLHATTGKWSFSRERKPKRHA